MLYITRDDSLLYLLQRTPYTSGVSGFVADWYMGCLGLPAISAVSNLIHNFEQAPGPPIHRGKSALIPVRQFSDDETASCLLLWHSDICDSSRERVIGVFIGIHVSILNQYYNAVHKFDVSLSVSSPCAIVSHMQGVHSLPLFVLRDLVLVAPMFMIRSQPSVSCSGTCAIGSSNWGARTQQSIVTVWESFQYHMVLSTPKCLHCQTR